MNDSRRRTHALIALIAVIAAITVARLRLADIPLERDEGFYATVGQMILSGRSALTAIHFRFTLAYPLYALILLIFGQTATGIHVALALVNAASMALVYRIGSRLEGRGAGLFAASAYGLTALSPAVYGQAANLEHFVVLFALGGLALLPEAIKSRSKTSVLACGLLFGAGALVKQPGLLMGVFGAAMLAWELRREPATAARLLAVYALGLAALPALVCARAWLIGAWPQFWYWNVRYSALYGSASSWRASQYMLGRLFVWIKHTPVLWLLALGGLLAALADAARGRPFLAGLSIASGAMVSAGFLFREHYLILLLPAVSLAAATAVAVLDRQWRGSRLRRLRGLLLASLVLAAFEPLALSIVRFCRLSPESACALIYRGNPFSEAVPISDYIQAHSGPDDRVLVLGSESEIYFYSRRRPANGFMDIYLVMEDFPGAEHRQQQLARESEAARPKFVVAVFPVGGVSWSDNAMTPQRAVIDWAGAFLQTHYHLIARVDLLAGHQSRFLWKPFQFSSTSHGDSGVELFEKNEKS